jgi:hypothetical protein
MFWKTFGKNIWRKISKIISKQKIVRNIYEQRFIKSKTKCCKKGKEKHYLLTAAASRRRSPTWEPCAPPLAAGTRPGEVVAARRPRSRGSRWLDLDLVREQGSGRKKDQMRERVSPWRKEKWPAGSTHVLCCGVANRPRKRKSMDEGKLNIAVFLFASFMLLCGR